MSIQLVVLTFLLLSIVMVFFSRYAPGMLLDVLDRLVMHLTMRPILAMTPTRDPVVRSFLMGAVLVCGFGLILSLSVGLGVAFATMLWPVVLTALLSGYASALAVRARKAEAERSELTRMR